MQEKVLRVSSFDNFEIPPVALWGIFGLFFLVFAVISATLIFHWRRYGMHNRSIIIAEVVYLSVSALLIVGAISALISL